MKKHLYQIILVVVAFLVIVGAIFAYHHYFAAPGGSGELTRFSFAGNATSSEALADALLKGGYIRNERGFLLALHGGKVRPGAYKLAKSMNAWEIAGVLRGEPYMKWVTIPEGLRKEEIADILAKSLGWNAEERDEWIDKDTEPDADHVEGVYFPDTYLIPVDEAPSAVAARLRAKFEEKFAPYAKEAVTQNIKWTTVVKLASVIQREAAGKGDMPLIAGILWNRLLSDERLETDSTVQYAKGHEGDWWPKLHAGDTALDSPYNTYLHTGLPPHPIADPGLDAIAAVLHPTQTECRYYLHDASGEIHCSVTYAEHQANIEKYLK